MSIKGEVLGTASGLIKGLQDHVREESNRREMGVPEETPDDPSQAFFMGYDIALSMVIDLLAGLDRAETFDQESIDKVLSDLAG